MKKKSKKNKTNFKKINPKGVTSVFEMWAWDMNSYCSTAAGNRKICGNCEHIGVSDGGVPPKYICNISGESNTLAHPCNVKVDIDGKIDIQK